MRVCVKTPFIGKPAARVSGREGHCPHTATVWRSGSWEMLGKSPLLPRRTPFCLPGKGPVIYGWASSSYQRSETLVSLHWCVQHVYTRLCVPLGLIAPARTLLGLKQQLPARGSVALQGHVAVAGTFCLPGLRKGSSQASGGQRQGCR